MSIIKVGFTFESLCYELAKETKLSFAWVCKQIAMDDGILNSRPDSHLTPHITPKDWIKEWKTRHQGLKPPIQDLTRLYFAYTDFLYRNVL